MKYLSFIFSSLYAVCATGTPGVSTEKLSTIFTSDPSKVSLVTSVTEDLVKTATLTNEGAKAYAEAQFFKKTGGDVSGNINIGSHALNANGIYVSSTSGDYLTFYRGPSASRPAVASVLHPDNSPIATSNMVEGIVSQHGGGGGGGGGPYLPLSGGTISGNLSVNGYLSLYSAGEFYDGLVLNYPPIISNGDGDTDYIDFIDDPGSTTSRLTIDGSPVATSNMVEGIISQHGGGGGGSEPSQYVKDATVSSGTLTLTKKSGSPVSVSASTLGALKSDGSIGMSGDIKLSGNKILLKNSTSYPYIVSDSTGGQMEFYSPNWYDFYRGTASPYETTYTSRLTPDGTPVQTRSSAMSLIKIATNMLAESLISGSGGFTTNIVTNIVTKSYVENLGISSDAYKIYSSNKTSGISGDGYIFTNAVKYTSSNQYFVLKQKTDHTGTYWFYDDGSSDWTLRYLGNNTWNLKSVRLSMGNTFNGGPNDTTLSCGAPLSTLTRSDDGVAKYADLVNSTRTINGKPLSSDIVIDAGDPAMITNISEYIVTNAAVVRADFSGVELLPATATTNQIIEKINELITILKTKPEPPTPDLDYFYISSQKCGLRLDKRNGSPYIIELEYSYDKENWSTYEWDSSGYGTYISLGLDAGHNSTNVFFRAGEDGNSNFSAQNGCYRFLFFNATGNINASGNIMSLLDRTLTRTDVPAYCFNQLFSINSYGEIGINSAPKLPATSLGDHCYRLMFSGSSITEMPDLPAIDMADYCYCDMFNNCDSLTKMKKLKSTNLATSCYDGMFSWCSSLKDLQDLPATIAKPGCYQDMFNGCDAITSVPQIKLTTTAENCCNRMFYGCSSLSDISVLTLYSVVVDTSAYMQMFAGCTGLTSDRDLPVLKCTEVKEYGMAQMYSGCSNLANYLSLDMSIIATLHENCFYQFIQGSKIKYVYLKTGCGYNESTHGALATDHTVIINYK